METPNPEQAATSEQSQDYDNMTEEQLDAELRRTGGFMEEDDPEPIEAEVETETVEAEAPAEETQVEEPESPVEAEVEDEPTESDLQLQQIQLENEKLRAERERLEFLSGRHAGELGHLKQQVAELRSARSQPRDEYSDDVSHAPRQEPVPDAYAQRLAQLEGSETQRGIEDEYKSFVAAHPDMQELSAEMQPVLTREIEPYREMIATSNAKSARKLVRAALTTAYAEAKIGKLNAMREQIKTRKAEQTSRVVKEKVAATSSSNGSAPPTKEPPKTLDDMTEAELAAELDREYGGFKYTTRR